MAKDLCKLTEQVLLGYIEKQISPELKKELSEHVIECETCNKKVNKIINAAVKKVYGKTSFPEYYQVE